MAFYDVIESDDLPGTSRLIPLLCQTRFDHPVFLGQGSRVFGVKGQGAGQKINGHPLSHVHQSF